MKSRLVLLSIASASFLLIILPQIFSPNTWDWSLYTIPVLMFILLGTLSCIILLIAPISKCLGKLDNSLRECVTIPFSKNSFRKFIFWSFLFSFSAGTIIYVYSFTWFLNVFNFILPKSALNETQNWIDIAVRQHNSPAFVIFQLVVMMSGFLFFITSRLLHQESTERIREIDDLNKKDQIIKDEKKKAGKFSAFVLTTCFFGIFTYAYIYLSREILSYEIEKQHLLFSLPFGLILVLAVVLLALVIFLKLKLLKL